SVSIAGLTSLRVAFMNDGAVGAEEAGQLGRLARWIVTAGGTVVVPENSGLLTQPAFIGAIAAAAEHVRPTLAYGEHAERSGFHVMEAPTDHWLETLTGVAGT